MIFEVGLGGRLDATNTLKKDISFITQVSLDHEEYLGDDLKSIASEKVAIFKNSDTSLVGDLNLINIANLKIKSENLECVKLIGYRFIKPFRYEFLFEYNGKKMKFTPVSEGFFQHKNIKNALLILNSLEKILNRKFKEEEIVSGINSCVVYGRLFKISDKPKIYIDGAHNISGFETIKKEFLKSGISPVILFGAMRDKNILCKVEDLYLFSKDVALVKVENERCAAFEDYRKFLKRDDFRFFSSSIDGYKWIRENTGDGLGIICGSLYLCGEILKMSDIRGI